MLYDSFPSNLAFQKAAMQFGTGLHEGKQDFNFLDGEVHNSYFHAYAMPNEN